APTASAPSATAKSGPSTTTAAKRRAGSTGGPPWSCASCGKKGQGKRDKGEIFPLSLCPFPFTAKERNHAVHKCLSDRLLHPGPRGTRGVVVWRGASTHCRDLGGHRPGHCPWPGDHVVGFSREARDHSRIAGKPASAASVRLWEGGR